MIINVSGFDRTTDKLVEEFDLSPAVTLEQLRSAIGLSPDDEFDGEFPITQECVRILRPHLDRILQRPELTWFLGEVAPPIELQ